MRAMLPGAIRLGPSAKDYHAAFLALNAVPDHLVPHAAGGGNDLENLVTACWPCNNGRGAYSLEEMGLVDPRSRTPVINQDGWDGLRRVISRTRGTRVPLVRSLGQQEQTMQKTLNAPRPARQSGSSFLSEAEYFDLLRQKHPEAVKPLIAFLATFEIGI